VILTSTAYMTDRYRHLFERRRGEDASRLDAYIDARSDARAS
jgi:hypothetical protein